MKMNIQKFATSDAWTLQTYLKDYKYNSKGELTQITIKIESNYNIGSIYDIDSEDNESWAYFKWNVHEGVGTYPYTEVPYIERTFKNLNNLKGVKLTCYEGDSTENKYVYYNFTMTTDEDTSTTYLTKTSATAVLKGNVLNSLNTYDYNNAPSVAAVRNYLDSGSFVHQNDVESMVSQAVSNALLAAHPIGSIELNITGDNPSTYLGGTWIQVSQGRAIFGEGTCSTTYNVRGTSQTFSNTYTADTNYAAGLPNITGTGHYADNNNAFAGALYNAGNANYIGDGSASGTLIALDASRDRAIYGKSNTVQPNAYVVYVWKRTA